MTRQTNEVVNPGPVHSDAIVVKRRDGSRSIHVAGRVGFNENRTGVVEGFKQQVEQTFNEVASAVQRGGGQPKDIVAMQHFIVAPDQDEYTKRTQTVNAVQQRWMEQHGIQHGPARTTSRAAGLSLNAEFEANATAEVAPKRRIPFGRKK